MANFRQQFRRKWAELQKQLANGEQMANLKQQQIQMDQRPNNERNQTVHTSDLRTSNYRYRNSGINKTLPTDQTNKRYSNSWSRQQTYKRWPKTHGNDALRKRIKERAEEVTYQGFLRKESFYPKEINRQIAEEIHFPPQRIPVILGNNAPGDIIPRNRNGKQTEGNEAKHSSQKEQECNRFDFFRGPQEKPHQQSYTKKNIGLLQKTTF